MTSHRPSRNRRERKREIHTWRFSSRRYPLDMKRPPRVSSTDISPPPVHVNCACASHATRGLVLRKVGRDEFAREVQNNSLPRDLRPQSASRSLCYTLMIPNEECPIPLTIGNLPFPEPIPYKFERYSRKFFQNLNE